MVVDGGLGGLGAGYIVNESMVAAPCAMSGDFRMVRLLMKFGANPQKPLGINHHLTIVNH